MSTASTERLAVDVVEAGRLASVSPSTIRRAIRDGKLAAAKCGARVVIRPEAITAWLIACEKPSEPNSEVDHA